MFRYCNRKIKYNQASFEISSCGSWIHKGCAGIRMKYVKICAQNKKTKSHSWMCKISTWNVNKVLPYGNRYGQGTSKTCINNLNQNTPEREHQRDHQREHSNMPVTVLKESTAPKLCWLFETKWLSLNATKGKCSSITFSKYRGGIDRSSYKMASYSVRKD